MDSKKLIQYQKCPVCGSGKKDHKVWSEPSGCAQVPPRSREYAVFECGASFDFAFGVREAELCPQDARVKKAVVAAPAAAAAAV